MVKVTRVSKSQPHFSNLSRFYSKDIPTGIRTCDLLVISRKILLTFLQSWKSKQIWGKTHSKLINENQTLPNWSFVPFWPLFYYVVAFSTLPAKNSVIHSSNYYIWTTKDSWQKGHIRCLVLLLVLTKWLMNKIVNNCFFFHYSNDIYDKDLTKKKKINLCRRCQDLVMQELVNAGEDVLVFYNDKSSFQAFISMMRSERNR